MDEDALAHPLLLGGGRNRLNSESTLYNIACFNRVKALNTGKNSYLSPH